MPRRRHHGPLLALNAALLTTLALVTALPPAAAQNRSGGEYVLLPVQGGRNQGQSLVVMDVVQGAFSVVKWNQADGEWVALGNRSLEADVQAQGGRRIER